jgi:CHAD domain-containing protein
MAKKKLKAEKIITALADQLQPVQPDDTMAEAGRKVLREQFIRMLQHEAGSRTGVDIEDVHQMRVAIRQQRSALRLLATYYKPKAIAPYRQGLKYVMDALGEVRDLDVMVRDLRAFEGVVGTEQAGAFQEVIDSLENRRGAAREDLVRVLDSKRYRRFVKDYAEFLQTPGAGAQPVSTDEIGPVEVRHVLPPLIYAHVAAVRAYDGHIEEAEMVTLHALRIEFKRLRYVVSLFAGVLGKEIEGFIDELKKAQDLLGRLNDIEIARAFLVDLMDDLEGDQNAALWVYIEDLDHEQPGLRDQFPARWQRFNTKTVQRKLALAVLAL